MCIVYDDVHECNIHIIGMCERHYSSDCARRLFYLHSNLLICLYRIYLYILKVIFEIIKVYSFSSLDRCKVETIEVKTEARNLD